MLLVWELVVVVDEVVDDEVEVDDVVVVRGSVNATYPPMATIMIIITTITMVTILPIARFILLLILEFIAKENNTELLTI